MNILITGGAGMVGTHCAEYFAKKNNKVIAYDSLIRSKIFSSKNKSVEHNWDYLKKYKNIKLIKNDIRNVSSLEEVFKKNKIDAVIHTAGQTGIKSSFNNPSEDFDINCLGTINVLENLKKHNPEGIFIYCSTNKVYGNSINKIPLIEKAKRYEFKAIKGIKETAGIDLAGHTPYGVSKLCGDIYTQEYAHLFGIRTGVFRMSCIYGTRQFGFEDQAWVAWFAQRAIQEQPINIYGNGKQVRDVLWIDDLVLAFDKFIKSNIKHEVFNTGGGQDNTLSLLELVGFLENLLGKKIKIIFKDWRKLDQKVYVSDISKIKKMLKWRPSVSPAEGVRRLVEWVKKDVYTRI